MNKIEETIVLILEDVLTTIKIAINNKWIMEITFRIIKNAIIIKWILYNVLELLK